MSTMIDLIFATHNDNKVKELQAVASPGIRFRSLTDIDWHTDLAEDQDTLEGNALQKATQLYEGSGLDCFADDTGLIVPALGGAPGVYSARYAGPQRSAVDNTAKLLAELDGMADRSAFFRTCIVLFLGGVPHHFVGECHGHILTEPRGEGGFGYDPVFMPEQSERSFAEMSMDEKNAVSHRKRAFSAMLDHLSAKS